MLLFAAAVGTATGVLFGLWPAWRASRVSPNAAMKAQGRGVVRRVQSATLEQKRWWWCAWRLLDGAGGRRGIDAFRCSRNLTTLDPGFQTDGVILASQDLRLGIVPSVAMEPVQRVILTRLRALPGVRTASISDVTPLSAASTWNDIVRVEGHASASWRRDWSTTMRSATATSTLWESHYHVDGRDSQRNNRDNKGRKPLVMIVNESMARLLSRQG